MIAFITGVLRARGTDWVQVEVGGVGFHISVPASLAFSVGEEGDTVTLHTRLIIRDDEPQLYGFPSPQALRFFYMLTGVSGIGPRSALNLLSARTPEALASAILSRRLGRIHGGFRHRQTHGDAYCVGAEGPAGEGRVAAADNRHVGRRRRSVGADRPRLHGRRGAPGAAKPGAGIGDAGVGRTSSPRPNPPSPGGLSRRGGLGVLVVDLDGKSPPVCVSTLQSGSTWRAWSAILFFQPQEVRLNAFTLAYAGISAAMRLEGAVSIPSSISSGELNWETSTVILSTASLSSN